MGKIMHIPCMMERVSTIQVFSEDKKEKVNQEKVKITVMHSGLNGNKSNISEEAIEEAKDSLSNIPILGFIKRDEDGEAVDFDQHNVITKIIQTSEGNEITQYYLERAIGTVPETNNYKIEEINDKNYVVVDGIVWRSYSNEGYDLIAQEGEKGVSMEIFVEDGKKDKNGVYNINKFSYLGITVLGDDVAPAMGGECKIELYSQNNEEESETIKYQKEEDSMDKNTNTQQVENQVENFNLSIDNINQEIKNSLYKRKCKKKYSWSNEEYEVQEFYLRTILPTENMAILEDNSKEGWSYVGVPYSHNKDEVVLDFDNKLEYIQTWRQKEKNEEVIVFSETEETEIISNKFSQMSEKIEELEKNIEAKDSDLEKLQAFKLEKDKEALTQEVNTIVARFSILDESEYGDLVNKALANEIDIKSLEHELYALKGMKQEALEAKQQQNFAQQDQDEEEEEEATRVPVTTEIEEQMNFSQNEATSRYGSLGAELQRIASIK